MTLVKVAVPVKNPDVIRQRVNEIVDAVNNLSSPEAANGVPAGGSNGQILAKASNADYDTEWVNAPSGGGGGGSVSWGGIGGTLSNQTDLQSALNAKQDTLASGTNIKTINGSSVVGSGNLVITPTIGEETIDFGAFNYVASVSVADTSVTSSTRVLLSLKNDPTRDGDELEMSPIMLGVHVRNGVGFDIYANALQGADGQFRVNYTKV